MPPHPSAHPSMCVNNSKLTTANGTSGAWGSIQIPAVLDLQNTMFSSSNVLIITIFFQLQQIDLHADLMPLKQIRAYQLLCRLRSYYI